MSTRLHRVFAALAREGLHLSTTDHGYRIRRPDRDDIPPAELVLPPDFPLESKALHQLMGFAGVRHPAGGHVCQVCATPDFHAGHLVPVGAVVATTTDLVVPQAIGTDINCGMRLHVTDLDIDAFAAGKEALVERLRGDLLLGTRDLPMTPGSMAAMFDEGCVGWLEAVAERPLGALARSETSQLWRDLCRVYEGGSFPGASRHAPEALCDPSRDSLRDPTLATLGSGNHFCELQVVEEILDARLAFEWGVRPGQVAFMIHTGSRGVGRHVGNTWIDRARKRWPTGVRHPETGIFALHGDDAAEYLEAIHTAANYGFANRLLLAELVRLRMREVYRADLEAPLVFDVPHNIVLREGDRFVHRKGATPAHAGQPVLIPGSMGHSSYLAVGRGCPLTLSSASHGAGRALSRFEVGRRGPADPTALGLDGVECITLKAERLIEEAPAAYKPITPVVDIQVQAGVVSKVARLRPLLTFKG
ncbi:RtcB family protein [Paraliomyxa miuraensis]|uniref:RtcB family protein n=1 Tax=Paraliomyxa miuraensis TaxID=376150 RepID=UPI0022514311|nr:RtcB family protein [Paraliomyxa miuraensis]MCX4241587.1 RtcB family protein [Paraliomyxa miuraensis]